MTGTEQSAASAYTEPGVTAAIRVLRDEFGFTVEGGYPDEDLREFVIAVLDAYHGTGGGS